jgi:hypothetical protein
LASLPPEVDVPLPLRLGFIELPVVGAARGVAELAAGSPIVDPRPLGAPAVCAKASALENARADATAVVKSFITASFCRPPKQIDGRAKVPRKDRFRRDLVPLTHRDNVMMLAFGSRSRFRGRMVRCRSWQNSIKLMPIDQIMPIQRQSRRFRVISTADRRLVWNLLLTPKRQKN